MVRFSVVVGFLVLLGSGFAETPDSKAYGRREINAQLRSIRIAALQFESAPLDEVLKALAAEAEKNSYPYRSLNLIARDIGDVIVTVNPPMENVALKDALDAVIQGASQPIKYDLTHYGIVFSRGQMPRTAEMLKTRVFTLKSPMSKWDVTAEGLREFFAAHGINCEPPFQVFLNARSGKLFVRAEPGDLEKIEGILKELIVSARRIKLELRFAEVPAAPSPAVQPDLSLDTGLKLPRLKSPGSDLNGIFTYRQDPDGHAMQRSRATNYAASGTLDERQFASVLGVLQQKAGVDLLTFPPRTTRDGERTVFTLNAASLPPVEGPSAYVHPVIAGDAQSIHLVVTAAVDELMGYEARGASLDGSGMTNPIFRLRQMNDEFELPIGHTAVLGVGPVTHSQTFDRSIPGLADIPYVGRLFRFSSKRYTDKNLWFFLTPRLEE